MTGWAVSNPTGPGSNEPKPFPIWKLGAAIVGLYAAYSVGYTDGRGSYSDRATYAAYENPAVEMPPDEVLVEAAAPAALAELPAPLALSQAESTAVDDTAYSRTWNDWGSLDNPSAGDYAAAAAEAAARDAEIAAEDAAAAASERESDRQALARFASTSSPSRQAATQPPPQPSATTAYVPQGGCAENGSCYGDISAATGRPKTVNVQGYYRRDGTYVRGHYRSR
jgi:hypothetical protein